MNTDLRWKKWGKLDPYYAVLTDDQFRGETEAGREEFFARGRRAIDIALSTLESKFGAIRHGRALDFGSGVGRLVAPLARQFNEVVGVDISEDMNEEAAKNCAEQGLSNTKFVISDDDLSRVEGNFDFVHTFIVLQHMPVKRGEQVIRAMLGKLNPGGGAMIHISLKRNQSLARRVVYFARHHIPLTNQALNLLQGRPLSDQPIEMNEYNLLNLIDTFRAYSIPDVLVALENHGACITARLYGVKSEN